MKIYDKSRDEFLSPLTLSVSPADITVQVTFKFKDDFVSTALYIDPIFKNKEYIKVAYRFESATIPCYCLVKGSEEDCANLKKEIWENDKISIDSIPEEEMIDTSSDNFLGWHITWEDHFLKEDFEKIAPSWYVSDEEKTKTFIDWLFSQKDKLNDNVEYIKFRVFEK